MALGDTNAVICAMDAATISGALKTLTTAISGSYIMASISEGKQIVLAGIQTKS